MKSKFPFAKITQKKKGLIQVKEKKKFDRIPSLFLLFFVIVSLSSTYISLASKSADWVEYSFPNLKEGDISPKREIALFDFNVPKPERQLAEERRIAANSILPVFNLDETVFDEINSHIDSLFTVIGFLSEKDISDSVRITLLSSIPQEISLSEIDSVLKIIEAGDKSLAKKISTTMKESFENISELLIVPSKIYVTNFTDELFVLENGDTISVEMTIEVDAVGDYLMFSFQNEFKDLFSENELRTFQKIILSVIKPNLTFDNGKTSGLRNNARDSVPLYSASFKKNERIIDANVPVTKKQLEILDYLKKEIAERSFREKRLSHYAIAIGKAIIGLGLIGIIVIYIRLYRRKIYDTFSHLLLLVFISSLPVIIGFYTAWSGKVPEFLIPVAISAILVTILYDTEMGILVSLCVSLIVSSFVSGAGYRIGVIYFLSSCVGVFTVSRVRHRKEFYRSMLLIPLTMAVSIAATNDWITNSSFTAVGYDIFLGTLNGFFCPILAIGLLPLLESLFKVTTDITLLELSDMNNPLLRELAVKAPGTYSSVLVVGTLAETAAEKVGANPLLCRVGSYYHDIGKMSNPEYFIENQMGGRNPHDRISPHMSALVIASHVKEGYELGVKHGLPEAVLDLIKQHHGTSLMQLIYHKAEEEAGDEAVDDSNFRYPGPKPQTREAGIIMLADLVEAARRTVNERSPGRLKVLINTIIEKRFIDGELNECELTLKDLHIIGESFLPILVGSQHGRIKYPWQKEENSSGKKSDVSNSSNIVSKEKNKIDRG
ncbi:MAG TPA: HDIG domain-containing protein [bacterium]|nr:HDIG domain-containing protein [bacterium]